MNIKDFFNKEIKRNILNQDEQNGNYSILNGVDYRNVKEVYKKFYTPEQIQYLFEHRLLQEYVKTGANWERDYCEYWEFTDKGKTLRKWYTNSLKSYIYYEVLRIPVIKWWFTHKWQMLMIKVFNKHYTWQEYTGVSNLDEI